MKVAFWSNGRGRACVTSNLACISVMTALGGSQGKTVIFENHKNIINLGSTLFSNHFQNQVRENYEYGMERGLTKVLHLMERGEQITEEQLHCMAEEYLERRLFYLPIGDKSAEKLEYYLEKQAVYMLECLEQYSNMVVVDTTASPLLSSRKILQQADLVVVNLTQNQQVLDHFFRNYSSIQKHAFYLIGNYDASSKWSKETIQKKYHIPEERIGTIPHNANFSDAVSNGELISFLSENYSCSKHSVNYEFIQTVKRTTSLMCAQINKLQGGSGGRWEKR